MHRSLHPVVGLLAVACLASGCGSSAAPSATGDPATDSVGDTRTSDESEATTRSDNADTGIVEVQSETPPPMEVVASLGYPRDLLDRGRVNVKISRDDDTDFVILDKQLVADHFTPAPVEERRTSLPPNGRVVALQTLFGDVEDCEDPTPVTATLDVTFTSG
ncbi:MAG: hypothetical protein WBV89_02145, partial [Ilumatobacter sp.]